jgi:hypothetical protein
MANALLDVGDCCLLALLHLFRQRCIQVPAWSSAVARGERKRLSNDVGQSWQKVLDLNVQMVCKLVRNACKQGKCNKVGSCYRFPDCSLPSRQTLNHQVALHPVPFSHCGTALPFRHSWPPFMLPFADIPFQFHASSKPWASCMVSHNDDKRHL